MEDKEKMKGIFRNFWLKIFSLFLAIVLWYYANLQNRSLGLRIIEKEIKNIPVKVLINPGSEKSFTLEPSQATVKIRGRKEIIEKRDKDDIYLFVDVRFEEKGTYQLPLKCTLPRGVEIVALYPSRIKVQIQPYFLTGK